MVRHYCIRGVAEPSEPVALFDVRLDVHDNRSGFRLSEFGHFRGEWLNHHAMEWTRDMVVPAFPDQYRECEAVDEIEWPDYFDDKIVNYFSRFVRFPIHSNGFAGLYSQPGESLNDFVKRCSAQLLEEVEEQLDRLKDIFLRRFLSIEKDLLISSGEDSWDPEMGEKRAAQIRELFSGIREGFSRLSLQERPDWIRVEDFFWKGKIDRESSDRLESLRSDMISQINQVVEACWDKARLTEIYEVPVLHSQVDIQFRAILWV